jgi:hypothetical protein
MKWKQLKEIMDAMTKAQLNRDIPIISEGFNVCSVAEVKIAVEALYSDSENFFTKKEIKDNLDNVSEYDLLVKAGDPYIEF